MKVFLESHMRIMELPFHGADESLRSARVARLFAVDRVWKRHDNFEIVWIDKMGKILVTTAKGHAGRLDDS